MAFKSKYKSKSKKRGISRKKRVPKVTKTFSMVTLGKGLPKKVMVTHKYNETFQITCTSGVLNSYQYILNGLYDPNYTGTGHQPMYFDQISALYNHYHVIGAKVTLKCFQAASNNTPTTVVMYVNDDVTITPVTVSAMKENSISRYLTLAAGANDLKQMSLKWSAKKVFGRNILANDLLRGSASANPSEQQVLSITMQSTDGSSTNSVVFDILIEYIAIWSELKDLIQN